MFRGYVRLIFFAMGLLLGIQLPAFVQLYGQRANAHFLEASMNFSGFQRTADRHFHGDVEAMLQHYEQSGDTVFVEGGDSIRSIWLRLQRFTRENAAMSQGLHESVWHVLVRADDELLQETRTHYDYTVPLDADAALYGVLAGVLIALGFDFLWMLLRVAFGGRRRRV